MLGRHLHREAFTLFLELMMHTTLLFHQTHRKKEIVFKLVLGLWVPRPPSPLKCDRRICFPIIILKPYFSAPVANYHTPLKQEEAHILLRKRGCALPEPVSSHPSASPFHMSDSSIIQSYKYKWFSIIQMIARSPISTSGTVLIARFSSNLYFVTTVRGNDSYLLT